MVLASTHDDSRPARTPEPLADSALGQRRCQPDRGQIEVAYTPGEQGGERLSDDQDPLALGRIERGLGGGALPFNRVFVLTGLSEDLDRAPSVCEGGLPGEPQH